MSSVSTSITLTQLINFLTRPLILTHPAITVAQLQLSLHANLSSFLPLLPIPNGNIVSPFTLHLSPHSLPITPIYAACLSAGVEWEDWVRVLTGGREIYVFVMEGCLRVGTGNHTEGELKDTVTIWTEEPVDSQVPAISCRMRSSSIKAQPQLQPASVSTTGAGLAGLDPASAHDNAPSPMAIKLQAMLDSVRNLSKRTNVSISSLSTASSGTGLPLPSPIRLPALPSITMSEPTAAPLSSSTPAPSAEPVVAAPVVASAPASPASSTTSLEDDSSADSDTESTTSSASSHFSARSEDSMTSVSSADSYSKPYYPANLRSLTSGLKVRSTSGPSILGSALGFNAKRTVEVPLATEITETSSMQVDMSMDVEQDQPFLPAQLPKANVSRPQQKRREWSPKAPNANANTWTHVAPNGVTVNTQNKAVTKYMYQGGQTGVVTGGVMLGSVSKASSTSTSTRTSPRSSNTSTGPGSKAPVSKGQWRSTKREVILGPDSSDWRRRV